MVISLNESSPRELGPVRFHLGGQLWAKLVKNCPKEDTDTQAEATEDAKLHVGIW